MTTNTFVPKNMSVVNSPSTFREAILHSQPGRLWTFVAQKTYTALRWMGHVLKKLQGHNDIVEIADVYYVRAGNQYVSRAMGHAYIESEAALMYMQHRIIM